MLSHNTLGEWLAQYSYSNSTANIDFFFHTEIFF